MSSALRMTLTRSQSQAISQLHANKEIASALLSVLPLLAQHQLQWHDIGRNPDCQFSSFIHASEEKVPDLDKIMAVRRAARNWLYKHPPPFVEPMSEWISKCNSLAFADPSKRKHGNQHSLRALAACFYTRINLIVVSTSGHHTQLYDPPDNVQHRKEIWLLYMDLDHTRHYLSTTKIQPLASTLPPPHIPISRAASRTSTRAQRATVSTEPINVPALAVGPGSRVAVSVPARQTPSVTQGASQDSQLIIEDIFANINHVQGDFVHRLMQNGALKFLHQI
jgi:hypothetical protein